MSISLFVCFKCLPRVLLTLALVLVVSASVARGQAREDAPESARDDPLQRIQAGELMLSPRGSSDYQPAISMDSTVKLDINGMLARVVLEQRFVNDSDSWLEGIYAFPLPDGAAVRAMEMRIGERRIVGQIQERERARQIYQAAREAGKKASLVEQQRPNLFTNRVANIPPREAISVRLEYVQPVHFAQGRFSLRFPMTLTPRYIPGEPLAAELEEERSLSLLNHLGWAVPTDEVPDANAITPVIHPAPGNDAAPLNPVSISASLDMGMPLAEVRSAYHQVAVQRDGHRYSLGLANGRVEMNRDFLLEWRMATGSSPEAAYFTEEVAGEHYGLLMLVPPAVQPAQRALPRELIFVIDTSGSMGGESIRQARDSLRTALRQLRDDDAFNVIAFNSSHHLLFREPVAATQHNLSRALEFVRQLDAGGGTEMLPALQAALRPSSAEHGSRVRQVVFITDGAVGNEQALLEAIDRRLGDQRLFTVAIGSAPNSWFMRKAAQFGRGAYTHIGDTFEVRERMQALFARIAAPLAVDIQVQWPGRVDAWPRRIPDLYAGEPMMVSAYFPDGPPRGEVLVTGQLEGVTWTRRIALAPQAEAVQHAGVASQWARQQISELLDSRVTGASEDEVRAAVLPLALKHSLASPYTSFVAVEEQPAREPEDALEARAVPNSRPHGQSPQPFAYARTATDVRLQTWLGCLALFTALIVHSLRRREIDHAVV
ncbi:MAG: marine proteobacterial sortase target protein [Pseudomonadota bacterium]